MLTRHLEAGVWMLRSTATFNPERNQTMKQPKLENSQPPPGGPAPALSTIGGHASQQKTKDFRLFWG
jgi:hypothetical protein